VTASGEIGGVIPRLAASLRDRILLGIWVFSYRIILLIFTLLKRLEAKGSSSV
jgi:hypothetical protein